jgi:hypothetical protein
MCQDVCSHLLRHAAKEESVISALFDGARAGRGENCRRVNQSRKNFSEG